MIGKKLYYVSLGMVIIFLAIIATIGVINHEKNGWFFIVDVFQYTTTYILPWLILIVLLLILKNQNRR